MVAKYTREVLMHQFNHFWVKQVPGLKPTQGYPLDAKRFREDIAASVELLNVRGDPLTTFSFKPAADAGVMIDGKKTKFTDLKKGEKISFYVSADRLEASELPGSTADSWAVLPPTP